MKHEYKFMMTIRASGTTQESDHKIAGILEPG